MYLMPIIIYKSLLITYYAYDLMTTARFVWALIYILELVLLFILNVHWYKLILIGLFKLVGIMKTNPKKAKIEAKEK